MKLALILMSYFILSLNNVSIADTKKTFLNYKDLDKCVGQFNDFNEFKSNIQECLKTKDKTLTEKQLNILSSKEITKADYSKIDDLPQLISIKPQYLYGADKYLRSLTTISNIKKNEIILNSYNSFNPNLLTSQTTNSNSNVANAVLALSGLFAIDTIMSSEKSSTISLSSSVSSISESSGSSVTITATASSALSSAAIIQLSVSGTATSGTDYSAIPSSITIPAGSTSATTSFTTIDDSISDVNETIIVSISSISGGESPSIGTSATVTITDDEAAPSISLAGSASTIAENSGSSITLTATSSIISSQNVVVSLAATGTATSGTDYSAIASSLTIPAGSTTVTATFTPTDDSIYDGSETAIFDISSVSGGSATENGAQQVTITITDNETAPTVTLSTSTNSVAENVGTTITLTSTLSGATYENVTVTLSFAGTSTRSNDYVIIEQIIIPGGQTSATTQLNPINDITYETNETIITDISSVSGGGATENGTQQQTITITNDDSAPTLTLASSASSMDEDGSAVTLTGTLSNPTYQAVTVGISASGTATLNTDYTLSSSNFTIAAEGTTGSVTATPTNDSTFEGDETVIIDVSSVSGGSATESGTQQVTVALNEDDASPELSINDVTTTDESATNRTLTVTLSPASELTATVDYATSDGTATAGSDYTAASGTLTFAAGDTSKIITVPVLADTTDEDNETVTVTLSNAVRSTISDATATLTITDDDLAPSLSINDVTTATESAANATFTVSLSAASGKTVTVAYATSDVTATEDADYTGTSGTLTFNPGDTSKTITVPVLADTTDESNETVSLTLSGATNASISDITGTLTITDDDDAPTLVIAAASVVENGTTGSMTVTLSAVSGLDVTVDYATGTGTATAGTDYTAASGTLTIPAGDATGVISMTIIDDSTFEGDETIPVTLSNPSNATITTATANLTIAEDDDGPTLSIADVSYDETAANRTMTVTLTPASGLSTTVDYATSDGTATAGSDYTAASGTLTFSAGETSKTITIPVLADTTDEEDETVIVTLSNAVRATISDATGIFTIVDDDAAPSLSINDVTTADESAADATFTVSLSAASTKTVTVAYATSDGTATSADYTSASGTLTFSPGDTTKTFDVSVFADSLHEANETVILTLSSATNASISDATGTLTITDDDAAPTLSIAISSASENAGTGSLTVTLSAVSGLDVTVDYATGTGTATAGTDYTAANGTLTISAGDTTGTILVTIADDSTFEGDETIPVTILNPSNATITAASANLTINEDDSGPSVSIAAVTVDEGDGIATVTVTLSEASGVVSTVDYALTAVTATAGSDYTDTSGTLTFSAGDTSESFTVTIASDSLDEDNETFIVNLSSASQITLGTSSATLTITDNDATPSLAIANAATADESTAKTVTVTLSTASGRDVTVAYSSSNGSATAGSDYTAVSGTLTISAGNTTNSIIVTPTDDSVYEDDETLTITLSSPTNASISVASATITITDDENAPTVILSGGTTVSESSGSAVTITATLSGPTDEDVVVTLTESGTFEANDFSISTTVLTIPALSTTATMTATPINDVVYEGDETLILAITGVSGGGATESGTQSQTIIISDDESVPTFSLSIPETTVAEDGSSSTITVTMSGRAEADATVTLTGSGTATAGTDYAALSSVSITSGNTTGSATFDPTTDSLDEASETAIITISAISLGSASPATGSSDSIMITDVALNSATSKSVVAGLQSTIESNVQYTQIDYDPRTNSTSATNDSPYDNINLAQALAYGDYGAGQTIAILDTGFLTSHKEFTGKTISTYGSFLPYSAANSHGTFVASIAAADLAGGSIMGVAPSADLHLSDFNVSYQPSQWTAATASAESAGAIVQNNSWGFDQQYGAAGADVFVAYKNNNGVTGAATLVAFQSVDTNGDGYFDVGASNPQVNWSESDWIAYVAALDSFQSQGVIVFALSNDSDKTNADISAALPALFAELEEAWIAAINVDITGTTSKSYERKSAPCGVLICCSTDIGRHCYTR